MRNKRVEAMPAWPLIVLLYTSVDTLLFGTNSNRAFLYVPRILGAVGIVILPLLYTKSLKVKVYSNELPILLLMLGIITISSVINAEETETYLSRVIVVYLAYIISSTYSDNDYFRIFDTFMYQIVIFAIITEILAYISPGIIRALPTIVNTSGYRYHTCFFSSVDAADLNLSIIRVSGILWEPGAFGIYLFFSLLMQLFVFDRPNIKHTVLYLIALLLTFSTTAYLSFGVLLLGFVISKRSSRLSRRIKFALVVSVFLFIVGSFMLDSSFLYNTVFRKLTSGTSGATTRYSSFFNGLRVAFDHPLFGVASNTGKYMREYIISGKTIFTNGGTSITNTIVAQYASYGIIFGTLFLIGTFRFLKKYSYNLMEWLILMLAVFMAYFGEKFFSFFPFVFAFFGLRDHKDK